MEQDEIQIEESTEDGKEVYKIKGRIDNQTAPELQAKLDESFKLGENNLILDFDEVDYLSSAGLRTILYTQKRIKSIAGASMTIVNVTPSVMEIFEMTGFTDFLTITPQITKS